MKLKPVIALLFIASLSTFFSACSSAASKEQPEVVIDKSSTQATDEVYITNADVKREGDDQPVSTVPLPGGSATKITLGDSSQVETLTDAFGNKTETRYFQGNSRLRMLILRTSAKGAQEVTVYGKGGETKIVGGLADRALTASGDEIANAAGLNQTTSPGAAKNFMKRPSSQSSPSLQPLPSSSFQQPSQPVSQPVQNTAPQTTMSSETVTTQPANPEKEED